MVDSNQFTNHVDWVYLIVATGFIIFSFYPKSTTELTTIDFFSAYT